MYLAFFLLNFMVLAAREIHGFVMLCTGKVSFKRTEDQAVIYLVLLHMISRRKKFYNLHAVP